MRIEKVVNMIRNLEDFILEFEKIKKLGWVQTHRNGSTGIGKTLEDLLGIEENNRQEPDFGEYELKSCRIEANSMTTILTKAPKPPKINAYLREKFGYVSDEYEIKNKVLHATLWAGRFTEIADTGAALRVACESNTIYIESREGRENAYWSEEDVRTSFKSKYKTNKLVLVKAHSQGKGPEETFQFVEAYLLQGINSERVIDLVQRGIICVDIRIGMYKDGRMHDHGTGFRIFDRHYDELFDVVERLC